MQRLLNMMVQVSVNLLSLLCFVATGHTQDIPKEGKRSSWSLVTSAGAVVIHPFSTTFAAVNSNPPKPVSLGKREIWVASFIITVANFGREPPMGGHCNALVDHDRTAKILQAEGYCNVTNRSGDHVFLSFKTISPVTLDAAVPLKAQMAAPESLPTLLGKSTLAEARFWCRSNSS